MSSLSASSLGGYIINILWSVQIVSLYTFLPVSKPFALELFLNASIEMQSVSLLPFELPNPLEDSSLDVKGSEIYASYSVDLYFLKGNINTIFSLMVYSLVYVVLFLIFRRL